MNIKYFLKRLIFQNHTSVLMILFLIVSFNLFSQTTTITSPIASATFCAGTNITVNYTVSANYGATNTFSTQLSDASGSFASPTLLGTRTAINGGGSTFVIPFTTATSSTYRVRILTSSPTFTSLSNGVDLTINGSGISTPTVSSASFCQGETFTTTFSNLNACNFSNTGFNNVYAIQMSDAFGSFSSPTTIGTRTATTGATVSCTIPASPAGTGYRVRVVSSNPVITSIDNGVDITIYASAGNPNVFGSGTWNVYAFNIFNNYTTNYQGFYTENNLSFDTRTRFANTSSPSTATLGVGATGAAYAGCVFGVGTNYSISYKRTNIPCGYYQIDIPAHDDNVYVIINGVQVFVHVGCCDAHTNVWTGIIQPSDNIEFRYTNGGGPGYLAVNFININPLTMSAPVTICAGTTASLSVANTSTLTLNYAWTPIATVAPTTGSMVVASPVTTTIYTVNSSDAGGTACSLFTNTVQVTVNPLPTTTISSITSTLICTGISTSTLTASGANSYTWSPAAGLNTVYGNIVIASPSISTTYTVSGSNNCSTLNASATVSVQTIPASPTPTAFGNNVWNVYCYDGRAFTNYFGYYTENNLSFNSLNRWGTNSTPSAAIGGTMGLAYQGCNIPVDLHSTSHKRTNFTCGYYQIDIPYHDDDVTVLVNGVQVFQHIGCCDAHVNVWTCFLGATSTVEIRHQEGFGGSSVAANFVLIPYPILSPPVTICAGTSTSLTASPYIVGANYNWTPITTLTVTTTGTLVPASPTVGTNYTCTVVDPVTTCSANASVSVTVNPLPTTTVSPTTGTINCAAQQYTLTAGGANTYTWSPSAGLSATSGYSVVVSPTITTTYTVSGNNNCATVVATATITVVPLIATTVFPSNVWNVYCHNNITLSNYYGYYTHTGTGATGYDFNNTTQWTNTGGLVAPSSATANAFGTAYQGCLMSPINNSLSFKRTGFTCGTYSVVCNNNDDGVTMFIDGVQVATRATSAASVNLWVGTLNSNSQLEFQLVQGGGGSNLRVTFNAATPTASLSTWIGGTNTDWFTASNWCGSGVPTSVIDALIPNSKPQFMPVINAAGAACRSLTITGASAAVAPTSALPAASLTISGSNSMDVYGTWVNNGVFNAGSGNVNILGATSSSIVGSAIESFYNLVINKTGAVTVTIPAAKTVQISNSCIFTNGIVNQSGTFSFLNGATVSGQSNNSYVDGQVVKVGTQAFTFPVGTSSYYRPISISAPSIATDNFTAKYYLTNPSPTYTNTSKDVTIDHISSCEYWILNRTGGSSNVNVTLTWNTTSCGVTNLADLIVARWDAGQIKWKDQGNGGTTGNTTAGSVITSGLVTTFSPFTLASRTSSNPLPIELVSFNCSNINRNTNNLFWVTASEFNNDYFALERSSDGVKFDVIGKRKGAGTNFSRLEYSFDDQNILAGISYYRLKQVDFDGKFKYSEICSIENNNSGISFYPNPVRNELNIEYSFADKPKTNLISVTDITGKQMVVPSIFSTSKVTLDCSNLSEGIYFLKIILGDKEVVNKFTIQK